MEQIPSWEANSHSANQNFLAFYGTLRFITVFTKARHWSLSWAICNWAKPTHLIALRSIPILSFHLRLGLQSGLFLSGFVVSHIDVNLKMNRIIDPEVTWLFFLQMQLLLAIGDIPLQVNKIRDSWATGWMIGVLGFDSRRGLGVFLFTTASRTTLGPHPASYPTVTRGSFPGGKADGEWSWPLTST
jgi:hypothetical protein